MFIRIPFKIYIGKILFSIGVTAISENDKWQIYESHGGMDNYR